VTDFINLKIKLAQSFRGAHRDRMYVRIFIKVSTHICMNIYIYIVFLIKKHRAELSDLACCRWESCWQCPSFGSMV
jgi:hypothetical protein